MTNSSNIPEAAKRRAKNAYTLLRQFQEQAIQNVPENAATTNEDLIKYGAKLHPYTYKDGATDDQAIENLNTSIEEGVFVHSEIIKVQLHIPNEQCMILWAARWVDQGCPRVIFDNHYASLLMSTDVGTDMLDKVVFPWRAFLIEMPDNLLAIKNEEGALHAICKVFVQIIRADGHDYDTVNIIAMAKNGLQLWRHGVPLEKLTSAKASRERIWGDDFGLKTDSRDDRILNLLGRLIISMCVALSDPDNYRLQKVKKQKHRLGAKYQQKPKLPEVQTFIIGKPTKINCRPALIDYIEGVTRKGPTVRFLVRGHWKFQPHGPDWSLRKLIKIDPYWKGPEEAKILTRAISMEKT